MDFNFNFLTVYGFCSCLRKSIFELSEPVYFEKFHQFGVAWSVTNNIHANQCSKNGCSNTKEAQTIFARCQDGGGSGGDGTAAGGGGAPPPQANRKAKIPGNPLTQAGCGEEFDVVVELDPEEYMSSTMHLKKGSGHASSLKGFSAA